MNKIIADQKDINNEIFWNYFGCQNPSFLAKDLIRAKQAKNEQLVNNINAELIDLRNPIIKKEIPKNENPNKIVYIIETILDFNKQKKDKGRPPDLPMRLKIFTPKQMLQRLPIVLAQVKAGNLNIFQMKSDKLYILCINQKKLLKKYTTI